MDKSRRSYDRRPTSGMELKRKNFDAFAYKNEVPLVNHVVQPLLSKMID
jgi:hypothetical protein